jgi:hypothetical protein
MRRAGWDKADEPGSITQKLMKQHRVSRAGFSEGRKTTGAMTTVAAEE